MFLHRVKTFNDENLGRLNKLRRVKKSGDVIINRFLDGDTTLKSFDLLIHEIKVIGAWVQSSDSFLFTTGTVQGMVIIETDHSGRITDECVGIRVPAFRWLGCAAEDAREPPHESTFAASGVSSESNHDGLLCGASDDCVESTTAGLGLTTVEEDLF